MLYISSMTWTWIIPARIQWWWITLLQLSTSCLRWYFKTADGTNKFLSETCRKDVTCSAWVIKIQQTYITIMRIIGSLTLSVPVLFYCQYHVVPVALINGNVGNNNNNKKVTLLNYFRWPFSNTIPSILSEIKVPILNMESRWRV